MSKLDMTDIRQSDAKFPDCATRLAYLKANHPNDRDEYNIARDAMIFLLEKVQAYTIKQYSLRDKAVHLLKQGNVPEAIEYLNQIGSVE